MPRSTHSRPIPTLTVTILSLLLLTLLSTSAHALVTTMVNATTSAIQEQWLIMHVPAAYGPETSKTPLTGSTAVPTDPYFCTAEVPQDLTGRMVLVQRGNCPFFDKSLNAQLAGARGVIVGNADDDDLIVMSYDKDVNATAITIPSIMVRKSPFDYLLKMHQHAQPNPPPPPPEPEAVKANLRSEATRVVTMGKADLNAHGASANLAPLQVGNRARNIPHFDPSQSTPTPTPFRIFPTDVPHLPRPHPLSQVSAHPLLSIVDGGDAFGGLPLASTVDVLSMATEDEVMAYLGTLHRRRWAHKSDNEADLLEFNAKVLDNANHRAHVMQSDPNNKQQNQHTTPTKPSIKRPTMVSLQLSADPFDPDTNPNPFYFYLSIDERGETAFVNFPFKQLQIALVVLMVIPLAWILFLVGRYVRLYWGFRCVEELVTNTEWMV